VPKLKKFAFDQNYVTFKKDIPSIRGIAKAARQGKRKLVKFCFGLRNNTNLVKQSLMALVEQGPPDKRESCLSSEERNIFFQQTTLSLCPKYCRTNTKRLLHTTSLVQTTMSQKSV
jgi:hypothetical protein